MPSYHLCADFRIPPPPNGHLALGTILKNLDEDGVQFPLNAGKAEPVAQEAMQPREGPHVQRGFTRSMSELRSVEGGIWARIAGGWGSLSAKFSRTHASGEILTVRGLLTRTFIPDEEYMYKAIDNPRVKVYVTARRLEAPIYMITGIMTARGASWSKKDARATAVAVEGGVPTEPTTASLAGGGAGYRRETSTATGVEGSDDFVLGIRVRKIWWEKGLRQVSDKVVGRVLGSGGGGKAHISKPEAGMQFVDDFELEDPEAGADKRLIDEGTLEGTEPVVWILPDLDPAGKE